MSEKLFARRLVLASLLLSGAGCSTIKSWFPDKERDYQFTSEIPELVIPDDLKSGGGMPSISASAAEAEPAPAPETAPVSAAEPVEATQTDRPSAQERQQDKPGRADAETSSPAPTTAASSLQIDQSRTQAARIVARAMSRQKLEIVERNIDKGYFYVRFDPDAVAVQDDSILDEINFIFGDDPSQEQEYRVTLREINPQLTEVTVHDSEGHPLSNAAANALLKLITDAINQDIPHETPDKETPANAEPAEAPATEQKP